MNKRSQKGVIILVLDLPHTASSISFLLASRYVVHFPSHSFSFLLRWTGDGEKPGNEMV